MPERLLEIPTLEEIRHVFGHDDTGTPAATPDRQPDDTMDDDHD